MIEQFKNFKGEIHVLKCDEQPFEALWTNIKKFELRKNDRGYKQGDILIIREGTQPNNPDCKWTPTGRNIIAYVEYILKEGYGLPSGYVIMSLCRIQ